MADASDSTPVRIRTRGMAYGAHAVGHADGKVIFVRGAAPDEEVECRLTEVRPRYAFADLQSVLVPSPVRRQPPCPYLPRCGGCPWQHLDYPAQLAAKGEIIREQLRRIAGIEVDICPVVASPAELGYRHRLKLRVQSGRVGFLHAASHDVVPIEHCLLAMPSVDAAIAPVEALVRSLRTNVRRIEIVDRGGEDGGVAVVGEAEGAWSRDDEARCASWVRETPTVHGLVLTGRGWRRAWGDELVVVRPEPDLPLSIRVGAFTQVSPTANQLLVATVLAAAEIKAELRVLDLFAGAGNFSIPCARRGAAVLAVEQQSSAADDGARNARALALAHCRFRAESAQRAVDTLADDQQFDVVILDPPRSGATDVMRGLVRLGAPRIVYVSCNPSSLARDLKLLAPRYRVDMVQPIDMFPHSYHIETVVTAKLAC